MSTKIYNGYRLPLMGSRQLILFLHKLQKDLSRKREQMIHKTVAQNVATYYDQVTVGYRTPSFDQFIPSYLSHCVGTLRKRAEEVERTRQRDPGADFSFSVTFYPLTDKMLATIYVENNELRQLWEDENCVTDYHYQNQTDQPEDVTDAQWSQREKDWDKALLGKERTGVPAQDGLSFTFCPMGIGMYGYDWSKIESYFPSFAQRLEDRSRERFITEYLKEVCPDPKDFQYSMYINGQEQLETTVGQKRLDEIRDELRPILKEPLTLADVRMNVPGTLKEAPPKDTPNE